MSPEETLEKKRRSIAGFKGKGVLFLHPHTARLRPTIDWTAEHSPAPFLKTARRFDQRLTTSGSDIVIRFIKQCFYAKFAV